MTPYPYINTILLCFSLLACTCVSAQTDTEQRVTAPLLDEADRAYLDSLLTDKFPPDGPGGTMLVAKDGVPIYEKSVGLASMELRVPNHPGNIYKIGSITKQFTAVAALHLAEAGKLDLSADIRKYLPEFGGDTPITVAQLMDHSSGIPSDGQLPTQPQQDDLSVDADSIVRYIGQQTLQFPPGEEWSYSNNAFSLLGIIVERVSGQALSDYWKAHIFEPLGMRNTYTKEKRSVSPGRATGYFANDAGGYDYVVETPQPAYNIGAGHISSSVGDMLRWHEGLMAGKVISKELLNRAWTPGKLNDGRTNHYNSGWALNSFQGIKLVSHGGRVSGFLSYELAAPERGLYAICLTNSDDFRPTPFVEEAVRRALDLDLPTHDTIALEAEDLVEYTGVYRVYSLSLRKVNTPGTVPVLRYVRVRNDSLFSQIDEGSLVPMLNVGTDRFVTVGSTEPYVFERDANGKVVALNSVISDMVTYGVVPREVKLDRPLPPRSVAVDLPKEQVAAMAGAFQTIYGATSRIIITFEDGKLKAGWPEAGISLVAYETLSKNLIRPNAASSLGALKINWEGDRVVSVSEFYGGREFVAPRVK